MVYEPAACVKPAGSLAEHMVAKLPDNMAGDVKCPVSFSSLRVALVLQASLEQPHRGSQEHTSYFCALASQSLEAEIQEWAKYVEPKTWLELERLC